MPSVLQVFQPAVGGVPTYVAALARGLTDRGWDVTVAGPDSAVGMRELRADGIRTSSIDVARAPQPVRDRALAHRLARVAAEHDAELIHGHSSKASALVALAGRRAGIPSIYTPHAWSFQMRHPLIVRAALAGTEAALTRLHRAVIAVCDAEATEARRWGVARPAQLRVVHTGLETEPPPVARRQARVALGLADDAVLVAWIGRAGAQKRPEDLATLSAGLPPQSVVAALGHGLDDDPELAALLDASGVHVLDATTDVATLLAAADVYALTSAWEGFPLAVLEAMRAALPVVAYDAGGVPEQVEDGVTGRVVEVGDTFALTDAVAQLVHDAGLRERFGTEGRARFEERFTKERMLDGIEETYAGVLTGAAA